MIKTLSFTILLLAAMPILAVGAKDSPHGLKSLEIYKTIVKIPTVAGRGKVPEMAAYLANEFREVGFKDEDIQIIPSGETVGMIVRYQGDGSIDKPILLLGHMDGVEALDKDWKSPPFELTQDDKYFYSRGTIDNKLGITMLSSTFIRLKKKGL